MRTPKEKLMSDAGLIIAFIVFIFAAIILPIPFIEIVGVKMNMPFCSYENNVLQFFDYEIAGSKIMMVVIATVSLTLSGGATVLAYKSLFEVYHPSVGLVEKSKG